MTRWPLVAVLGGILCVSLPGQYLPLDLQHANANWREFLRDHGERGWSAIWSRATGTPTAVIGPGVIVAPTGVRDLDHARRLCRGFLRDQGHLLGMSQPNPEWLRESIAVRQGNMYVLVYDQYHDGLPVVGGRADVRLHASGRIAMFGSRMFDVPESASGTPLVAAQRAREIAAETAKVTTDDTDRRPLLVLFADRTSSVPVVPRLAWSIDVSRRDPVIAATVVVDARDGTVLDQSDNVHRYSDDDGGIRAVARSRAAGSPELLAARVDGGAALTSAMTISGTVTGWANTGLTGTDPLGLVPLRGVRIDLPGSGTTNSDVNGNFSIPFAGAGPVALTVSLAGARVGDVSNAQGADLQVSVNATPGTPVAIEFGSASSPDTESAQVTAYWSVDHVHGWSDQILTGSTAQLDSLRGIVASVNESGECNAAYFNLQTQFFSSGAQCTNSAFPAIVFHEWGHGLDDVFGGISATDGMSEGWGDIVSLFRMGHHELGTGLFRAGGGTRSGLNPETFPVAGAMSPHQEGQTWMGFAWDVRTRLQASLGAAPGTAQAENIVIGSVVANAQDQPAAVLEVFILDDDDGNLANGTPNHAELAAAATARNLPFPDIQLGAFTHTALADTDVQFAARAVETNLVPTTGTFSGVNLVYTIDGGSAQTRTMLSASSNGDWLAVLPGLASPQRCGYHFEAQHSTGNTLRHPRTGEFEYRVGQTSVALFEDFESGAPGWTHGATGGIDDWEVGGGAGRSGGFFGFDWVDPTGGFSGVQCAGNDLGQATDGAYVINSTNWLRTPSLDLTGHTGVVLRYRRQLSVEPPPFDTASILLGTSTIWSNPPGVPFLDANWIEHEIPLPQADGDPSVVLEWRLQSDDVFEFGGWNVDDVEVSSFTALPPPALRIEMAPAQATRNTPVTLSVHGSPSNPTALLIDTTPGPTVVPGLITLDVGTNFLAVPIGLDSSGSLAFTFPAPNAAPLLATLIHWQVVQVDLASLTLTTSNPTLLLSTP